MKLDDEAWARWTNWIGEIKLDLQQTVNDQAVFNAFTKMVKTNSSWINAHHGAKWVRFVTRCYVHRVALGIRRQRDGDQRALSIFRLLDQIQKCAAQLTFDFYLVRFPPEGNVVPWQRATFDSLSSGGTTVDAAVIGDDLDRLESVSQAIGAMADRTIAHRDQRGFDGGVTFEQLDAAVSAFNRTVCKYVAFMTGAGYTTLEATIQYDWAEVFRYPLVSPENQT